MDGVDLLRKMLLLVKRGSGLSKLLIILKKS